MFVKYVTSEWPSSISSNVQLLGLFPDAVNISKPTTISVQSAAMFKAAILLSHQYNITIDGQFIGWQSVNTGGDAVGALKSTCLMVSNSNIVGIVGSVFSRECELLAPFAKTIGIPIVSYGATDPDLSDRGAYPAFYRTIPSDNEAAMAIVDLFVQYNWTSCVIIYQNDDFGSGGVQIITDTFNNNNLTVTNTIVFDMTTLTVRGDLKILLVNSSTRLVLVWAEPANIIRILQSALDHNVVGPKFTWILSSTIPLDSFNQTYYNKLIGILAIEATIASVVNAPINTTLLNTAYKIWQQHEPTTFPGSNNVEYFAQFAFDATWTLIQALDKYCSSGNKTMNSSCISFVNTSFCFDRQLLNFNSLFNTINKNSFLGISGLVGFNSNVTDRISGNYYVAKNVQGYSKSLNFALVSTWSNDNGWVLYTPTSVIVWPGNTLIRPTGYAAISDMTFRIAMIVCTPYLILNNVTNQFGQTTTQMSGYMVDLLEFLQTNMGFNTNITILPSNQSYDGLIDAVANGMYDMVIADVTITSERSAKVGFSSSIFDNSLRVIIRQSSSPDIDLFAYLRPFSSKLWLTLLITTIYAGFLIVFLERRDNEMLQNRSFLSTIALSMWYSVSMILGFGADFYVRTAPGRLLTVGLYILSLISIAAYTANLASDLTVLKTKTIISGIDDIKNGKLLSNRIGIKVDTSVENYYLQEISDGVLNFHPLYSTDDMFNDLLNNVIDASIFDAAFLEYVTGNIYCNLTLVGAVFDSSSFGIVFQKNWQYAEILDVNILSLAESGTFDNLRVKWFETNVCSQAADTVTSMSIEAMAGLFLTFGIITFFAIFLCLWHKRSTVRKYLLILIHSKHLLTKETISPTKSPEQSSTNRSRSSQSSLSPKTYF